MGFVGMQSLLFGLGLLRHLSSDTYDSVVKLPYQNHSTVTLLAKLRGLSTSVPRAHAV